jgi:predicted TIM-barrel fold metal-dependent hydrolase
MGENLPYSLIRAQDGLPPSVTQLPRSVTEYFFDHFFITTSGYFATPPLMCALDVVGADRPLYSVDYPYRSNAEGAQLLTNLAIAPADLQRIAAGNAERVLNLQPQATE